MSSLIIGELGIPVTLNQSYQRLYEKYLSDLNISPKDTIIFDSRGNMYIEFNEKEAGTDNKYYIYSKNFSSENVQKYFEDNLQKIISSYNISLNLIQSNLPEVHQNYSILEENSKYLKISASDIKTTYEKMLEYYENLQVIYKAIKINCKVCEEIKNCYQYQYCGINSIIKHINSVFNLCEKSKQEATSEYEKLLEIKSIVMKEFTESVEKLKKTELHPKMQTRDKKYLIDLYYDEDKMNNWKDTCVGHSDHFANAISDKNRIFANEGNKIVSEKSSSITDIKNEWNLLGNDYEKIIKDIEGKPINIYNEIIKDFLDFKSALMNIVDIISKSPSKNLGNNPTSISIIEENCKLILNLKQKYSNFILLTSLEESMEPLNDLCSKMRKSMENFAKKIHCIFINFSSISNSLLELSSKYENYLQGMKSLEDSFSSFRSSSFFPIAYQASIGEIKRRIIFNKKIKQNVDLIDSMVFKENLNRKEFIQNYGKYLPSEYYPCLKFCNIKFIPNFYNDNEIALLPNLLNEEEEQYLTETYLKANLTENSNCGGTYFLNGSNCNLISNNSLSNCINEMYSNILNEKEKIITSLQKEIEMNANNFQNCNEQFQSFLLNKEIIIKEKNTQIEMLKKSLNGKLNGKLDQCPICNENATNPNDFNSWTTLMKDFQKKINDKEKIIREMENKIQNLVTTTNEIKKSFFYHLNSNLAIKNKEISNLKTMNYSLEEKIKSSTISETDNQKLKKMIEKEKNLSSSYMNELKNVQAQLETTLNEKKKIEKSLELCQTKLSTYNDKLTQYLNEIQKLKKDNDNLYKSFEDKKLQNIQIQNLLKISQNEVRQLKDEIENFKKKDDDKNEENFVIETSIPLPDKQETNETNNNIISANNSNNMNNYNEDNIISIKNIREGSKCIFVPHSEGVYACINLNDNLKSEKDNIFKCEIVLDLDSFDEDKKELILENSLIIIGIIEEFKDYDPNLKDGNNNNDNSVNFNLPDDSSGAYKLAKLKSVDYILGFPGEELSFVNYNCSLEE